MSDEQYLDIHYEVAEGRARITLARPKTHNAISQRMLEELEHALWRADEDQSVHCVILRGDGPSFCAGYDLAAMPRGEPGSGKRTGRTHDDDVWFIERCNRRIRTLWEMHKPSIAQVHGACLAGGTDLAMACDLVVVADDTRFGFPAARSMGALPSNLWMYHCGPQWTKRLQLTGDAITGADAAKIGLALKSVPIEQLEDEAEGIADRLALIDPDLLSANKRITNLSLEMMGAQVLQRLAAENDARAHRAPGVKTWISDSREHGVKEALRRRDEPFGDGIAHVEEPDGRLKP